MTKLSRAVAPLSSILIGAALLTGCAGESTEDATDDKSQPPASSAHAQVGSFVMHVRPQEKRVEIRRIPAELRGSARLDPQNLNSLPVVSDNATGTGPDSTVELATTSTTDTYGAGASGSCPAGSFCGDVQLTHFYRGLDLSALYVQVTAITDANGAIDTKHAVSNGVASTPFGIDVSLGTWQYTALPGALAYGTGATKSWAFKNPDDADFYVYLDVKAALYPTLWFRSSGLTQTAPLVAGTPLTVHYEYARNTGCSSATSYVWNTFLKATNIDAQQVSFANQGSGTYYDVEIITPFGGGMDFWFNKDAGSCVSWDSGNNFNVGITNPIPAIHFGGPSSNSDPYWTTAYNRYADSGVKGGATITVDYEPDRIACLTHDQYRRFPSGTFVKMGYAFDGNSTYTEVSLTSTPYGVPTASNGVTGQMIAPPTIAVPVGSGSMKVYFYTNASTCTYPSNYDSNFGNNWQFNY